MTGIENNQEQILVEFTSHSGPEKVSLSDFSSISKKSTESIDKAMRTAYNMAQRTTSMISSLQQKPNEVEIEFGIIFDSEVGALIAKTGIESSVKIKLTWKPKSSDDD